MRIPKSIDESIGNRLIQPASIDDWRKDLGNLSRYHRHLILAHILEPDGVANIISGLGSSPNAEERTFYESVATAVVPLLDERSAADLRDDLNGVRQSTLSSIKSIDEKIDPLQYLVARSYIDLADRNLKLRILSGPDKDNVKFEFSKDVDDVISLSIVLVQWALEAIEEASEIGIDPRTLVDAEVIREQRANAARTLEFYDEILKSHLQENA